jgi:hypothetical protein
MDKELVGRRGWLAGMGAAGGLAATGLVAGAVPAAATGGHDSGLAGSWLVNVTSETGDQIVSVGSFAIGGVAITHDIQPAGPPFTGTWAERSGNRFRATLWSGFPGDEGPGSLGPTARLRLVGKTHHNRISGTFTFTLFAPDGTELNAVAGTFSGRRIEA